MKKMLFLYIPLFVLAAGMVGACDKEEQLDIPALQGTKWKLAGIVNEDKMLQILEPQDCEECYTLTFETNTFATGLSIIEEVCIDLSDLSKYSNIMGIGEFYDGDEYRTALASVSSYSVTDNELKLHYGKAGNYLLFKSATTHDCGVVGINNNEFIAMQIKPDKASLNADSISLTVHNQTKEDIIYGAAFSLDYFDKQIWIPIDLDIQFEDIGYILKPNEIAEVHYQLFSGCNRAGRYRIKTHIEQCHNCPTPCSEIN